LRIAIHLYNLGLADLPDWKSTHFART